MAGVRDVSAGRAINLSVARILLSGRRFRNGDWLSETCSAVFSVSSKTGSPVELLNSAITRVSFSVNRREALSFATYVATRPSTTTITAAIAIHNRR